MKLELSIVELQKFLRDQYNVVVYLKNTQENRIEARYFISVVLIFIEVKSNVIRLHYELSGWGSFLIACARYFLKKKVHNTPFEWNPGKKEFTINLNEIPELTKTLAFITISGLRIDSGFIDLIFNPKDKK